MADIASQYRVVVKSGPERGEVIAAALKTVDYWAKFYHFKGREHTLPVVTLPIDLLMYRLANARTRDDQLTLVARGQYSVGFFDVSRQEDVDVQQAQHEILFDFSQQGKGDSVVAILSVLEKEKKQTVPILITSQGVIVNGNRRVSAMRELLSSPGTGGFNHVSCMVLPDSATESDLIEIEFKLQMSPETRLPYTWTNEARICKQLRDAGKSAEQIAEMKDEDPKRVNILIQMYETAERYQLEWLQRPGDFETLDNTRQAFHQMVTRRQQKRPEQEKEVAQAFDFFVVENRGTLDERAYEFINAIESDPAKFATKFAESSGIELPTVCSVSDSEAGGQLLIDIPQDDTNQQVNLLPLIDHLRAIRGDRDQSESTIQAVESVVEVLTAQKKDAGGLALKFARDALKKLSNVDPLTASKKTIAELAATLEQIEKRSQVLLTRVGKL